ncbi:hypothetical protein [Pedobacter frigiditerrae]|uniref:hypothetical protein n=1 Tax=Pedobacter frigiditerrae TaxID=2530452 RepID=UPI00293130CE|nr:hypothetical protein [Pedobacter frigiditerrae]
MINLEQKNNKNPYFEILNISKGKTVICSSFFDENKLILTDWKGNVWCTNIDTQAREWEINVNKPILFELISYQQKLYACNENSLFEIDKETGHFKELLKFTVACSVVHKNNKVYLNERSKKGPNTTGRIIEIDLDDLSIIVLKEEKEKSTYGALNRKEIVVTEKEVIFYADRAIYKYSIADKVIEQIYHNAEIESRIKGMMMLNDSLLFVPGVKNKQAGTGYFPQNPNLNSIFIKELNAEAEPIDKTIVSTTVPFIGNFLAINHTESIATYGGYVFFHRNNYLTLKEVPQRNITGQDGWLFKNGKEAFLLEPTSFNNEEKQQGFRLYHIKNDNLELLEEFITNKLGKNYREPEFDFFKNYIVVRCDGQAYLLKKYS